MRRLLAAMLLLAALSGCGPSYSPNTYSVTAVQQANTVAQGVIIGLRSVSVSAAGTVGTLTGAAAGGIAGSQAVSGPVSAFTALGGTLVGGIAGSAVEHTTADTTAFEYIVRKASGDLVSVTQKDKTPLTLGQKVLVIAGNQARVVPDYTVLPESGGATAAKPPKAEAVPAPLADPKPGDPAKAETAPSDAAVPATNAAISPPDANPGHAPAGPPTATSDAKSTDLCSQKPC
jgi:outer membrane lipoprotein SlyB